MMREFRGQTVITFDTDCKGAIVVEHLRELEGSIQRWLEKNLDFIEFVIPIEDALKSDPIQAMFCGPVALMQQALRVLEASGRRLRCCGRNIRGGICRLWTYSMPAAPRGTRWSAGRNTGALGASRSWPLVIITTI